MDHNSESIEMNLPPDFRELACSECAGGTPLDFDFSMAFQPIIDIETQQVFAYEALVRGLNNEPASFILDQVHDGNRYRFDQCCRVKAIKLASELGMQARLSINFMPNAVYRPELCIRTTLAAAELYQFPIERIIFEITEGEKVENVPHVFNIIDHYRKRGFMTAIDDFGAGYAGLNLLADMQTDIIKLDMALIRNVNSDRMRQAIVKGILQVCSELSTRVMAEGVETAEEFDTLRSFGISLFQGYYFARPAFEALPAVPLELLEPRG